MFKTYAPKGLNGSDLRGLLTDLSRVVAIADFGCANDPLYVGPISNPMVARPVPSVTFSACRPTVLLSNP